jgi:hypothetical protein
LYKYKQKALASSLQENPSLAKARSTRLGMVSKRHKCTPPPVVVFF